MLNAPLIYREFLGIVEYYRRHIPLFSQKAKCLTALLKKGAPFVWDENGEYSFKFFKHSLVNASILRAPDFNLEFRIYTDRSTTGIGSCIQQEFPGSGGLPIMFLSRGLTGAEKRYSTTEIEFLALIFTIKKLNFT